MCTHVLVVGFRAFLEVIALPNCAIEWPFFNCSSVKGALPKLCGTNKKRTKHALVAWHRPYAPMCGFQNEYIIQCSFL